MLRLFKVTCWGFNDDIIVNFIVADNEIEAKRIAEEETWFEVNIKCVEEIDMSLPQLLCSYNTIDIDME